MPPAVIFIETDSEVQHYHYRPDAEDDWPTPGENWDEELLIPGRLVYVGQGQSQFVRADQPHPGILYPKRRKKKRGKKKGSPQLPPPSPSSSPAPIDWDDWEELCQEAPPVPAPPPPEPEEEEHTPSEPEDWEDEIACYHAAYHHQPEDWEAEMALYHHQPEDWEAEIASQ
jgi:hypothetical protein